MLSPIPLIRIWDDKNWNRSWWYCRGNWTQIPTVEEDVLISFSSIVTFQVCFAERDTTCRRVRTGRVRKDQGHKSWRNMSSAAGQSRATSETAGSMKAEAFLDSFILSSPKRRSSWVTGRNLSSSTALVAEVRGQQLDQHHYFISYHVSSVRTHSSLIPTFCSF